jgi:hypothetical protein
VGQEAVRHDADVDLDDTSHQIESLRASGQTVLVFDQLYNRHLDGPRAQGWSEVVEHVLAAQERWASVHS